MTLTAPSPSRSAQSAACRRRDLFGSSAQATAAKTRANVADLADLMELELELELENGARPGGRALVAGPGKGARGRVESNFMPPEK